MDEHITNPSNPFDDACPLIKGEEWEGLFELSVDLLSVITFDGYFKTLNPAWEHTLGFERAELYSLPVMNFVHPADQEKTMDAFEKLSKGSNVLNFENRYVCKDGSYRWFMWNAIRSEDLIYCVARDVTQQKEMETALRESEKKLRLISENTSDLIGVLDTKGIIQYASLSHKMIIGFSSQDYEGNIALDFVHPNDRPMVRSVFEQMILTKIPYRINFRYRHASKCWIVVECSGMPVINEDGKVTSVVVVARDITERHQAEEALQESERQLRTLINALPDCVFFKDGEGRWLEVNDPTLRLFQLENIPYKGKKESELASYSVNGKDTLLHCEKTDEQAWETRETIRVDEILPRPDGTPLIFDTIKVPIFYQDGRRKGLVVIGRDITERKQVEEALMEAEAKYRSLVEEALVGVYICQDGHFLYVNPRCAEIFGYTEEEMLGRNVLDIIVREDRPLVAKNIEEREKGWVKSCHYQFQAIKKDGSIVDCEVHGTKTIYNGKSAIIGSLLDITERKKTEEILRKTEKLAVVGELAAGVAHEIRNPLTALKGFAQLLQSQNKENSHYYEIMLSELERINSIVSEFLLLAKPQIVNFQRKSILSLLEDVIALLQSEANKHNVQIVREFTTNIPLVNCEENQLKQVFINILKNAIEAMPSGGSIAVKVKFIEGDNKVSIRFMDEGCGISEERLARLGEPFYTTKEKGTGLGLTVSHRIIENHRGTIDIKSLVGEGTEVNVILPV